MVEDRPGKKSCCESEVSLLLWRWVSIALLTSLFRILRGMLVRLIGRWVAGEWRSTDLCIYVTYASFHAAGRTTVESEPEDRENSGRDRVSAASFRICGRMSFSAIAPVSVVSQRQRPQRWLDRKQCHTDVRKGQGEVHRTSLCTLKRNNSGMHSLLIRLLSWGFHRYSAVVWRLLVMLRGMHLNSNGFWHATLRTWVWILFRWARISFLYCLQTLR